ncbi:hypothetical protein NDU88_003457 [Pleurodeles waltl]|uniref:Uncharacterized protein n=1 Tax=Pleurodeles waltl TaxID=8319 RepID=A0AAV7QCW8_PLEWA|nr:hypothetical protein NDU88_003457 [Pleurodeles waltl]
MFTVMWPKLVAFVDWKGSWNVAAENRDLQLLCSENAGVEITRNLKRREEETGRKKPMLGANQEISEKVRSLEAKHCERPRVHFMEAALEHYSTPVGGAEVNVKSCMLKSWIDNVQKA